MSKKIAQKQKELYAIRFLQLMYPNLSLQSLEANQDNTIKVSGYIGEQTISLLPSKGQIMCKRNTSMMETLTRQKTQQPLA